MFEREVRVLDDAEHVAVRVEHSRHPDAVADVLNPAMLGRSEFEEPPERRVRIVHTPVSYNAGASAWGTGFVRLDSGPQSVEHHPYLQPEDAVSLRELIVRSSSPPPNMQSAIRPAIAQFLV
jgi:hypothetical protein